LKHRYLFLRGLGADGEEEFCVSGAGKPEQSVRKSFLSTRNRRQLMGSPPDQTVKENSTELRFGDGSD
jgi:hypothetical protein